MYKNCDKNSESQTKTIIWKVIRINSEALHGKSTTQLQCMPQECWNVHLNVSTDAFLHSATSEMHPEVTFKMHHKYGETLL